MEIDNTDPPGQLSDQVPRFGRQQIAGWEFQDNAVTQKLTHGLCCLKCTVARSENPFELVRCLGEVLEIF